MNTIVEVVCRDELHDLKSRKLQLQLHALALIGKLVTGPWMQQFYGHIMMHQGPQNIFQMTGEGDLLKLWQ